tara:strand:- start:5767 stop:6168 length:402 start_codon:yes stop_codon:yes gene_type:complete
VAKATLIEATQQSGGGFVTLDGTQLVLDVKTDISIKSAMMYMDSHNITVEFDKSDFKDIDAGLLENIALKLKTDASKVEETLFPAPVKKKSMASKAKSSLTGSRKPKKSAPKKEEKPAKEEKESVSEEEKSDK